MLLLTAIPALLHAVHNPLLHQCAPRMVDELKTKLRFVIVAFRADNFVILSDLPVSAKIGYIGTE
jgi:hypothetical protein